MNINARNRYYSPQLDGLRFFAALAVYISHAPAVSGFGLVKELGWSGVDLFLCISAFLITRLLRIEYLRHGGIGLRRFYIRRALRIWPLYLAWSSVACLWALAGGMPGPEVGAWWLSHISGANNLMTALQGYSPIKWTAHLWTISLEEQAYIVMPFAILALSVYGVSLKRLCRGAALLLILMCVARLSFALANARHPFIWTLPLRADAFVLGSLAAIYNERFAVRRPGLWSACGVLFLAVAFALGGPEARAYQVVGYPVVALGFTCVVVSTQGSGIGSRLLSVRPLRYLGTLSYGIYVYHSFGIFVAHRALAALGVSHSLMVTTLGFLLTVALAAISYRVLESPFLRLKEKFATVRSRPV